MNNIYLKNPEDEYETAWFLLNGGIFESIRYDNYESFNEKLWNLLVAMTSRNDKDDKEKTKLTGTLDTLILMVKGCHYFLHHKKRLKFKEDWIDIKWLPNPYRCLKKYRSKDDQKHNHYLAHFEDPFTKLSREESQNFSMAFENFFFEMDLSSWLNLLDDWKSCLLSDEILFEWEVDYAPLKTYEHLLKLYEACLVSYHWAEYSYPPPNRHLLTDFLASFYDGYRYANPLETIDAIFGNESYENLRQGIIELYKGCSHKRKGLNIKTCNLSTSIKWLLETGWLLLQTDFYPEDWLDPNSFSFIHCLTPEKDMENWRPRSLSVNERKKIRKTLSKLYYQMDIREEIREVDKDIFDYLDTNSTECLSNENFMKRNRLLKILDIQALIIMDLCKRRTKSEGIRYPEVVPEEDLNLKIGVVSDSVVIENI
ncbi:hypothetical protein OKW96_14880 [Sphingobacterium sp. KU25419]|nr:hypothetical protein OKW96_14880 [Sphingobacterium sp. KU25419]